MKKIFVLIFIVLVGCTGLDSTKSLQILRDRFPTATIFVIPNYDHRFIVVTDSDIHYIELYNINDKPKEGLNNDILIKKL
jgi:hypothetical protein